MDNINNTYNSGIKTIPSKPDKLMIEQVMTENLINAVNSGENKKYNIGDTVRKVVNKNLFDKGSIPKWSSQTFKIKDIKCHSYLLDNGRSYKYYQLQKVNNQTEQNKNRMNEMNQIRKENKVKRDLNKEGVSMTNITTSRKTRAKEKELTKQNTRNLRTNRKSTDRLQY